MVTRRSIPPSFSLIQKEKLYLLCHEDYKELLVECGGEDLNNLLHPKSKDSYAHEGRRPHPVLLLKSGQRAVLRQYIHGGLLRFFTGDLFLFGARSFRELALTEEIRSHGIPTVIPIAAIHQILLPPLYRPYLLTLEVPGALNLIQYLRGMGSHPAGEALSHKRKMIRSAGHLLRRFHQSGFYHGDLQLKNLLVSGDQVLIIDFDRSHRQEGLSVSQKVKNLLRLNRSVEKWKRFGLPITRTDRWRFLMAYSGGDTKILKAVKKALRTYSIGLFFHRCGWAIEKFLRSF